MTTKPTTVETVLKWKPGGAQCNLWQLFHDGEEDLFAIRLAGDTWEIHTVTARCDSEDGCNFENASGEEWADWAWSDVEWFTECRNVDLPFFK